MHHLRHCRFGTRGGFLALAIRLPKADVVEEVIDVGVKTLFALVDALDLDAVEGTRKTASQQIKTAVNSVVFPAIDLILAVFFFAKLGTAYFDYRKHGQFEWALPTILFACLVFTLTVPLYIWSIVGM